MSIQPPGSRVSIARAIREARLIGKLWKVTGAHISAVGLTTIESRQEHTRELISRHSLADVELPPDEKADGVVQHLVDAEGRRITFAAAFELAYDLPLDGSRAVVQESLFP